MRTFMKIIGGVWAFVGLGNIVFMPWTTGGEGIIMFGLIFNMMLFVFPGLILYRLGDKKVDVAN